MTISRRGFVKAAVALPVVALPGCAQPGDGAESATARNAGERVLDPATLRALADVVLPSELGPDATERAVVGFEAWIAGYRPVAERDHGYGTGEIRYTGPDPAPGWKAQLEAWDLEAGQRQRVGFAELGRADREAFVRDQLRNERSLTDPAQAQNVALGLLSWWTASTSAADLCHGVAIGRETCRPLSELASMPRPLPGRQG